MGDPNAICSFMARLACAANFSHKSLRVPQGCHFFYFYFLSQAFFFLFSFVAEEKSGTIDDREKGAVFCVSVGRFLLECASVVEGIRRTSMCAREGTWNTPVRL